jgi:hypothetical protein
MVGFGSGSVMTYSAFAPRAEFWASAAAMTRDESPDPISNARLGLRVLSTEWRMAAQP